MVYKDYKQWKGGLILRRLSNSLSAEKRNNIKTAGFKYKKKN